MNLLTTQVIILINESIHVQYLCKMSNGHLIVHWTFLLVHWTNGHLNVHWTFLFAQWTNGHLNVVWTFLFVHWSNGHMNVQWTFLFVQWSNGHLCMSNGHYWYLTPSMIMLVMPFVYWKLLWINSRWGTHAEMCLHVMLALDMSIRPLDDWTFKCPMDISICPFVHWTSGHIQMSDGHLDMSICPLDE